MKSGVVDFLLISLEKNTYTTQQLFLSKFQCRKLQKETSYLAIGYVVFSTSCRKSIM